MERLKYYVAIALNAIIKRLPRPGKVLAGKLIGNWALITEFSGHVRRYEYFRGKVKI
jgi:hypothetical protein